MAKSQKTRRLNAIRRLTDEPPPNSAVLYIDEVDVHLNPKIGPDWMMEKQQKDVLTPGQNAKHYLAGALDAITGRLQWVEGPKKTSALFIVLVDPLLACRTCRGQTIHLVLDNFRIHSSRAVAAAQGRVSATALSAASLPRPQSHRTPLEGPARQCHP